MSFISKSLFATTAVIICAGLPAYSQSLAEEVVQEYFDELAQNGLTVNAGSKSVSGTTVEWRDLVITLPDDQGVLNWPFIRAQEIGNGKVSMTYPEELTFDIKGKGEMPGMNAVVNMYGVEHIISGTASARQHDFKVGTISYEIKADGDKFGMSLELQNLEGGQVHTGTDIRHFAGAMTMDKVQIAYNIADNELNMAMIAQYNNITVGFDVDSVSEKNMAELLSGKRNMSVNYSIGSGSSMTDMTQPEFSGVIDTTVQSGKGSFSIVDGIAKIIGDINVVTYDLKFSELPFPPFQAEIDFATFHLEVPLKQTDEVVPAKIIYNITGLTMSDTVWGMVDPTGSLPRDKANLNIDLTANMKWLVDLVEMDKAPGMPAEVQDVTINDITLEVAGARLQGKGFAVIDNSKFPPEPVGAVNIDLKGGFGLLDKLMALGLVPQDQGQMVKMFSGMFTQPGGDGDDHLTSKIEMKEGGSILVNGNQVK